MVKARPGYLRPELLGLLCFLTPPHLQVTGRGIIGLGLTSGQSVGFGFGFGFGFGSALETPH